MPTNVFLSCGRTSTDAQERLVRAVEQCFEAHDLRPQTVGRNVFAAQQPLKLIDKVMRRCAGAAIIAYERTHIALGKERRGSPQEVSLVGQNTATCWNQIEAAYAYALRLPILVIVEQSVRREGLLEAGFDHWVINVGIDQPIETNLEFGAIFRDWRKQVARRVWTKGPLTQFQVGERVDNVPIATTKAALT